MQSHPKASTTCSSVSARSIPSKSPESASPAGPAHSGKSGRSAPANAFSALYLEKARHLEEPPFERQALFAGPWEVEPVEAGRGTLYAVVRRGDAVAEGGRAVAVFLRRPDALVAAAALTALSVPNRLTLNTDRVRSPAIRRRMGFPLHDGTIHLGHLARPEEDLLPYLHAVRCLVASPDAMALAHEALGPELLPILGRLLMRRLTPVK